MDTDKIFQRKKQLIERDPLYHSFCKTHNEMTLHRAKIRGKYEYRNEWPQKIRTGELELTQKLVTQQMELINKWHVYVKGWPLENVAISKYRDNINIMVGRSRFDKKPVDNSHEDTTASAPGKWRTAPNYYISKLHRDDPFLDWTPYPNSIDRTPSLESLNDFVNESGDNWLPILVNTSRLNKSDAKKIKSLLWRLIESNLQKGSKKRPYYEHQSCEFLYKMRREVTFHNYLKWYDIRMKEKFSYRLIAHLDRQKKPGELLEKLRAKKIKWGISIKGEDKIEKGFKLIYEAIHRRKYNPRTDGDAHEEYKCSTHTETECPVSCKYFKDWEKRFNSLNPV